MQGGKTEKRKINVIQGLPRAPVLGKRQSQRVILFSWRQLMRQEPWKGRLGTIHRDINLLLKDKLIYLNTARLKERISQP